MSLDQSVTLKGVKEGFRLTLDEAASYEEIIKDTEKLLEHLKTQEKDSEEQKETIQLEVYTGDRLLNEKQQEKLTTLVHENSRFRIEKVAANVLTYEESAAWQEEVSLQMKAQTIRSGQVLTAPGDILLVGKVHPGGMIRAEGSIFIIGELHGVAHAGLSGDTKAVIVADFHSKAQIRIAENVEVIEEMTGIEQSNGAQFAFVNDLHMLNFESLDQLKKIRPSLEIKTGGFN